MTTNPWERLREAVGRFGDFADHAKKCHVTRYRSAGVVNQTLPACTCGFGGATDELREALAALPATPPQQPVPDGDSTCDPCREAGRSAPRYATTADDVDVCRECFAACEPVPDEERERAIKDLRGIVISKMKPLSNGSVADINAVSALESLCEMAARSERLPGRCRDAEREAFLPPFDHCDTARQVVQQLGFELQDGYLSPVNQAKVDHAAACIETLMRSAPAPQPVVEPVHLSSEMHSEFVTCGIECTPSLKRTRRKPGVTCRECLRVAKMGDESAKPVPAPPASDWREQFEDVIAGPTMHGTVKKAMRALHDGLIAAEADAMDLCGAVEGMRLRLAAVEGRIAKIERGDA